MGKCEDKLNWSGLEDISKFYGERLKRKVVLYISSRVCHMVTLSMGYKKRHELRAGYSVCVNIRNMGDTGSSKNIKDQLFAEVVECNWVPAMILLHCSSLVSSPSSPSRNFPNKWLLHKQVLMGTHHILHLTLLLHGAYYYRDNN